MSDEMTQKKEKIRLIKIASEYNISTETLMSFLKEKGYEVKSANSVLTEPMINDIMAKFKTDIEKAEKHNQKVYEFNKKRGVNLEENVKPVITEQVERVYQELKQDIVEKQQIIFEDDAALLTDTIEKPAAEEAKPEKVEEVTATSEVTESKEVYKEEVEKTEKEESIKETKEEVTTDNLVTEPQVLEPVVESELIEAEDAQTTKSEVEGKKSGLTILGKVELEKSGKEKEREHQRNKGKEKYHGKEHKEEKHVKAKEKQEPERENKFVVRDATPEDLKMDPNLKLIEAEQAEGGKKKKKKKKLKAKKNQELTPEEQVKAKKKRKVKKLEVDKKEVEAAIKRTLLSMEDSMMVERANARKKKRKEKLEIQERLLEEQEERNKTHLKVTEFVAVNELANLMKVPVAEVIQKCIGLGLMVSINQRLDIETITLVADEFGFEVEIEDEYAINDIEEIVDTEESLKPRPPVVTIMGHVDHGKTSLLDYIRKTRVVFGESGGITQHIGAYQVKTESGKLITFLDTPGHEAFTAMRARGARVTDIVVLVVAADDAVMPQTVEAINHAMAANVPIIVAINKIDKPNANPEKIRQQLAERNILVEDWGGKYQCVEISAKAGINIDQLLEKILIEAEMMELKANPDRPAYGTIIESQIDKGRGVTATVLVQKGTLKIGVPFVAGIQYGRVRAMFDERNEKVEKAGPATPVLVLGYEGTPQAGDTFVVVESEKTARSVALKRQQIKREQDQKQVHLVTLDEIASQISMGGIKELPIIVKGDVDGSVEALSDSFMKLTNKEVVVKVIHKGVGAITEGDVLLAAASRAIIIGFHVRPNANARKLAETEKVDIRLYNVIYDAINEVKSALEGLLSPVISEELTATVEVRQLFRLPKVGVIAGCYVQSGKLHRSNKVRVIRDGIQVFTGEIASLKRLKDDVREVDAGYECGLNIASYNDLQVGDIIEAYKVVETKKKLD